MTTDPIDVRGLPNYAFGRRDPLWWGIVVLMMIEGTGFALLLGSYFYVRNRSTVWPPVPFSAAETIASISTMAVLLLSLVPAHQVNAAAYVADLRRARGWQAAFTLVTFVAVGCRVAEFWALPVPWNESAYGSLLWGFLVLHTTHLGTATVENVVLSTLLFKGPVERKHLVDLEVNGIYWYFVVAAWAPIFVVLHLGQWVS